MLIFEILSIILLGLIGIVSFFAIVGAVMMISIAINEVRDEEE